MTACTHFVLHEFPLAELRSQSRRRQTPAGRNPGTCWTSWQRKPSSVCSCHWRHQPVQRNSDIRSCQLRPAYDQLFPDHSQPSHVKDQSDTCPGLRMLLLLLLLLLQFNQPRCCTLTSETDFINKWNIDVPICLLLFQPILVLFYPTICQSMSYCYNYYNYNYQYNDNRQANLTVSVVLMSCTIFQPFLCCTFVSEMTSSVSNDTSITTIAHFAACWLL